MHFKNINDAKSGVFRTAFAHSSMTGHASCPMRFQPYASRQLSNVPGGTARIRSMIVAGDHGVVSWTLKTAMFFF
jgi:hypothetical protein